MCFVEQSPGCEDARLAKTLFTKGCSQRVKGMMLTGARVSQTWDELEAFQRQFPQLGSRASLGVS